MPQVKQYTAKQELHLDCGHTLKPGETFQVTRIFTCMREASWPLTILMACFDVLARKRLAPPLPPQRRSPRPPKPVQTPPNRRRQTGRSAVAVLERSDPYPGFDLSTNAICWVMHRRAGSVLRRRTSSRIIHLQSTANAAACEGEQTNGRSVEEEEKNGCSSHTNAIIPCRRVCARPAACPPAAPQTAGLSFRSGTQERHPHRGRAGSGKSRLLGRVITWQALLRGLPVVGLDLRAEWC